MAKAENITKRVPKGNIKFNLQLSDEQKKAKAGVYKKDVSVILGKAATGKTQVAVLTALDLYFKRKVNKIIISRPVLKNKLGFLPGELESKMAPQISPIKYCMYEAYDKTKIDKMFEEGVIEILPIDFMKGVTYRNACVIIDEVQDSSKDDFELILTRLGKDSKLLLIGSAEQVDKQLNGNSCISYLEKLKDCDLVNYHTLTANHRNEVIFDILKFVKK